tara:strand:- start:18606 stop:19910 length:1305 start_codon:yes stop_codon:yes gene_type:complete
MIYVYTHKITSRVKYAFNLIFKDLMQIDYELITNRKTFEERNGVKLAYTLNPIGTSFFIRSKPLLFEQGIRDQDIAIIPFDRTKAFFGVGGNSMFSFDIFAASFYLASRYEEYLPHKKDHYNRFDADQSLAFHADFLHQPVINIWVNKFVDALKEVYPDFSVPKRDYQFITTIDIDNAYAYKEKGFVRMMMGYAKSLFTLDFKGMKDRTRTLMGFQKDPYDTFDYQEVFVKEKGLTFIYFFLLGDYGINDKNIPVSSHKFQSLIKSVSDHSKIGIHPSFASNASFQQLEKEVGRLSKTINREVTCSRQHFLKLNLPETYRNLIELDITDDYTMGYASNYGFRAGLCTPFCFYDLDLEVETNLKVNPFAIMEGTLKYYMEIGPEHAMAHYRRLIDEVKMVNGNFISLWHNDSLNDQNQWAGWRAVFEEMIEYGKV